MAQIPFFTKFSLCMVPPVTSKSLSRLLIMGLAMAAPLSAQAVIIDFETASGYTVGNLYGQPGIAGSATWGASSQGVNDQLLKVVDGAGVGGSHGLVYQTHATTTSSVYQFNPTATDLGEAFSATSSQIAFSFDLKWDEVGSTSIYTGRFFVGNTLSTQDGDVFKLTWSATGAVGYTLNNNTLRFATNAAGNQFIAQADTFYTISGVLDYGTKTYTLSVNGVQQVDQTGAATLGFVRPAGANVNANFEFQTQNNNHASARVWTVDNLDYHAIPEASSLGLLMLGGGVALTLFRARKRLH